MSAEVEAAAERGSEASRSSNRFIVIAALLAALITAAACALNEATTALQAIAAVITRIDEGQRTITDAVEQQSATTDLLARNVGAVSAAAGQISGTVSHISTSSAQTAEGANTTRHSAELVSGAADEIRTLIAEFRY